MSLITGAIYRKFSKLGLFHGSSIILFIFLISGPSGIVLRAQTIRIRLVNGRNGRPMVNTCVNVGIEHLDHMLEIPTDKDGIASFRLTDKAAETDVQSQKGICGDWGVIHPVVKYSEFISINAGYVLCELHPPDYSWLATKKLSTKEVLQSGIVTENTCGKAKASPKPGEITLFVRPLTLWEKLKS